MFKFLKSLFGGDSEINKHAGVQIEQVPYKIESPKEDNHATILAAMMGSYIPPTPVDKVTAVNNQPIAKAPKAESKPAAITAEKKTTKKPAAKKAAAKKPAAKKKAAK